MLSYIQPSLQGSPPQTRVGFLLISDSMLTLAVVFSGTVRSVRWYDNTVRVQICYPKNVYLKDCFNSWIQNIYFMIKSQFKCSKWHEFTDTMRPSQGIQLTQGKKA